MDTNRTPDLAEIVSLYPWFTLGKIALMNTSSEPDASALASELSLQLFYTPSGSGYVAEEMYPEYYEPADEQITYAPSADIINIIDSFLITGSGRIAPVEMPADAEIEDISAASVAEDEAPVSETLAQIYVKQGMPEKAKEIYAKLCLIYPEKSIYFAHQMDSIK